MGRTAMSESVAWNHENAETAHWHHLKAYDYRQRVSIAYVAHASCLTGLVRPPAQTHSRPCCLTTDTKYPRIEKGGSHVACKPAF